MKTKKRDLFGGALFSAGLLLATQHAGAGTGPSFVFDDGVATPNRVSASLHVYTGMISYPSYVSLADMTALHGPVGPFNYTYVSGLNGEEMTAYANITHDFIRTEVHNHVFAHVSYNGVPGYHLTGIAVGARAFIRQPFNTQLHIEWAGLVSWFSISVRNMTTGVFLIDLWEYFDDGGVLLDLEAGDTYRIFVGSSTLPFGSGDPWSWVHAELVPAPSALPLLAMCALGMKRRRR